MFEKSFRVVGKTDPSTIAERRINNLRPDRLATLQLHLTITDTGLFKHPLISAGHHVAAAGAVGVEGRAYWLAMIQRSGRFEIAPFMPA